MMTRRIPGRARSMRAAFTLVELLVVITIIAILVGLTTAAITRVKIMADRTKVAAEIAQLSNAVASFKQDRAVTFIPSKILLREDGNYNMGNPQEAFSATYLRQVWPQLRFPIDWNNNGSLDGPWLLEGDQCLVFFLGGIGGTQGFASNPQNPVPAASNTNTKTYFEFPAARLMSNTNPAGQNGFPSFSDPFKVPYAYFSTNGVKNGYNAGDCTTLMNTIFPASSATATSPNFIPYRDTGTSFFRPTGFQIVSAGYDNVFGIGSAGGVVLTAGTYDASSSPDADNLTNFNQGVLSGFSPSN
jgi:prepilin-type N-terminal cleavage/methylation domain-containing protein